MPMCGATNVSILVKFGDGLKVTSSNFSSNRTIVSILVKFGDGLKEVRRVK